MSTLSKIEYLLYEASCKYPINNLRFFQTYPGGYAEYDQFLGIQTSALRSLSKQFVYLSLEEIEILLDSPFNEERLLALFILILQYNKASIERKNAIYELYLSNIHAINNWNLVDSSAPHIIGAHLFNQDTAILRQMAKSHNLWERRIAIVSTLYFIQNNHLITTFRIAELLLDDLHHLIHKATGWLLREAGKKNEQFLLEFIKEYRSRMPKIMLRYASKKTLK